VKIVAQSPVVASNLGPHRLFLLADALKPAPGTTYTGPELREKLALAGNLLLEMSPAEARERVHDDDRRRRFGSVSWEFGRVALRPCRVWPEMRGRHLRGSVEDVLPYFWRAQKEEPDVENMRAIAPIFSAELPIIIIRVRRPTGPVDRIDDGSHRAVAMGMDGQREVWAWVGVTDQDLLAGH